MLAVRRYRPEDRDATIDIFLRAVREIASRDYAPAQIDAWARVEDRAAWGDRRASRPTWIATRDGVPAGFSDLKADGRVDMLFVHPAHRGVGIAGLLLATVEAEARRRGLTLLTTEASLTARPFFQARGFRVTAEQEVVRRGERLRNARMEKRLPLPG